MTTIQTSPFPRTARRLASNTALALLVAWSISGIAASNTGSASAVATQVVAPTAASLAKLSSELRALTAAPFVAPAGAAWARADSKGVLVKVLIVATGTDPDLVSLRADVLARGGSVYYNYLSVRAVAAMLPATALTAVAARSDVINISPNRVAQRQASLLQAASDAGDYLPGAGTAAALDGRTVAIAVLDSGIDYRHKSLVGADGASRVLGSVDIVALGTALFGDGWNAGVDYSPSTKASIDGTKYKQGDKQIRPAADVPDPYGHGTAVASVAAGAGSYQSPDASGIAPGASLYDVRVLNAQGVGTVADVLAGIDWVNQRAKLSNIRVMNMSLGAASTDSFLVDPLARAARSAVANGIVVVVSAGNAGKDASGKEAYGTVSSPGNEPSVITVGADNAMGTADRGDDVLTSFSSRGPTRGSFTFPSGDRWTDNLIKPDLVASGNKVITASATDASGLPAGWNLLARSYPVLTQVPGASQLPRQTLMALSGTSIAAPAVTGAAALLLQANPGLTPPLVKAILQYSATPLAGANLLQQGTGLLNVEGAVRLARSLRTDIAASLAAGTIKLGDNLLAAGATLPTPASVIGGKPLAWSRMTYAAGTHLVSGEALFTRFQPIWDPALTWARHYVLRSDIAYFPASKSTGIVANTVPSAIVERNASAQPLLTAGVRLLDGVAGTLFQGASALMTPLTTLSARANAGMGRTLGTGFSFTGNSIQADGFTLSQGFILDQGFTLKEGFVLNQGFVLFQGLILNEGFILNQGFILGQGLVLREGFILNEGLILRETSGDPSSSTDASFLGD